MSHEKQSCNPQSQARLACSQTCILRSHADASLPWKCENVPLLCESECIFHFNLRTCESEYWLHQQPNEARAAQSGSGDATSQTLTIRRHRIRKEESKAKHPCFLLFAICVGFPPATLGCISSSPPLRWRPSRPCGSCPLRVAAAPWRLKDIRRDFFTYCCVRAPLRPEARSRTLLIT